MGTVATVTIGSDSFSVYALTADALADANSYFAAHIDATEWNATTDDRKKQALVTATRAIDREEWSGEVLVDGQATDWPRQNATRGGVAIDDGTPDDIALGGFELALYLLKDASLLTKTSTASNVKGVGAGSARVDFFYPLPGSTTRWPLPVHDLLVPYMAGSATGVDIVTPYIGGADDAESDFTSIDADRTEGFA